MIKLNPNEFDRILPLTREVTHHKALIYSVIENHNGSIFVNDKDNPTTCLIVTNVYFLFLLGDWSHSKFNRELPDFLFNEVIPGFSEKEMILFSYSNEFRKVLDEVLKDKGVITIQRKQFSFNPKLFNELKQSEIGEALELKEMDQSQADQLGIELSSDAFGYCLVNGEEVLSYCYSIFVFGFNVTLT